ncbi:MAG: TonB family protein [Candidatus Dactylopiibacterium sp.]|nr:TonB family protein [Candidatus Dactylopiibacterium sp.]
MSARRRTAASAPKAAPRKPAVTVPARVWRRHVLPFALAASFALHAVVFAMDFVSPGSSPRKHEDKGLRVVLVNARHQQAPRDAQALAQANLDGGGNQADARHMPTSPLPPQDSVRDGDALVERAQRVRELEARQRELLTSARESRNRVSPERAPTSETAPADSSAPERGLDLSVAQAIARQAAVIDRRLADYAARPRKGFISPRTREHDAAMYGEAFRAKLERVGEFNFPRSGANALYGSVRISVEIKADGSLADVAIDRADPDPRINEAALRIVRLAAPFARIPPELRQQYDILVLTRTMNFTREDISLQ